MGSDSIDLRQSTATPVRVRKLSLNGHTVRRRIMDSKRIELGLNVPYFQRIHKITYP